MKRWWRIALLSCWFTSILAGGGNQRLFSQDLANASESDMAVVVMAAPIKSTLEIAPVGPTSNDQIQVTVGGSWSNSCIPTALSYTIADRMVTVDIATSDLVVCGQTVTPWSLTADLGELPQGVYQIQVKGAVTLSTTVAVVGHRLYLPTVNNAT